VNIPEMMPPSAIDALRVISDHKSLVLLSTIALSSGDTSVLLNRLEITKKQYYSRMSALVKAGLIMRKNGDYFLTSFGKVVYEAQSLIENARQNYWKLKAIDSIESSDQGLTPEERSKVVDSLKLDNVLKEGLISRYKIKTTTINY
jgi:DNA-binding HxlR family transcriptional regulator